MAEFLEALNGFYQNVRGTSDKNDTSLAGGCDTEIPASTFHLWMTLPSVLMMFLLACTIPRKNKCLDCFWGRPGAVFPMDILGKSHRFSYAAAWGAIAFLAADLVFGSTVIVDLKGPPYVTVFKTVLEMIVIGVDYFPLFAALALQSVAGYMVGTAYAWMLLGVQIFRETECELVVEARLILILRDLPNLLCLAYLSVSLPVRTAQALYRKSIRIISSSEMVSIINMEKESDESPEGLHVQRLLKPSPPPPPPPEGFKAKLMELVKSLFRKLVYHNVPKFRYSARILSVMLIGVMLIYKATLEVMVLVLGLLQIVENGFITTLGLIGWDPKEGEEEVVTKIRDYTYLMYYILVNGRICFVVAMSLACASGLLTILHMLASYRTNLFDLYKGDNTHIPHRNTRSNPSLLVGSMRYAGYQVAYIAWGLVLHFIIFLLLSLAVSVIITMITEGFYKWIITIIENAWPAVVMTIVVLMTQTLLAKFAFLQDKGTVLAIDNRRVLFSFTFFMFFYNIFIGFLSCLMRIIKSIVIGAVFLPRLDNSALPRRFQMFDPGFANYCGFIHVECAHTHPVMVMFLRLLLIDNEKKKTKEEELDHITVDKADGEKPEEALKTSFPRQRLRNRWCVLYTLHSNPSIRILRKSHMRYMQELQERIAKRYHLSQNAMGKLVKHMNDAFERGGNAAVEQAEKEVHESLSANWNALFGRSDFLRQLQRDIEMEQRMQNQRVNGSVDANGKAYFHSNVTGEAENKGDSVDIGNENPAFVQSTKTMWKKAVFTSLTQNKQEEPETHL